MARRIVPVLVALIASVSAVDQCYYPGGTTIEPNHVPCNQTITGASACCDPLDSCSTSGICLGRSGWTYRGSCTDQTWGSANCPIQFSQCLNNPTNGDAMNYWAAIWTCTTTPGVAPTKFCCGYGSESCCDYNFTLGVTGPSFKPGYDAMLANLTSEAQALASATASSNGQAASATTSSSPSSTSSSSASNVTANCTNSDLGTKVGVGVGVPLGILAIGILSFLFWRESGKRNRDANVNANMNNGAYPAMKQNGSAGGDGYYHQQPPHPQQQQFQSPQSQYTNIPTQHQQQGTGFSHYAPVRQQSLSSTYSPPADQPKQNPWSPAPTYEVPATHAPQELPNSPHTRGS